MEKDAKFLLLPTYLILKPTNHIKLYRFKKYPKLSLHLIRDFIISHNILVYLEKHEDSFDDFYRLYNSKTGLSVRCFCRISTQTFILCRML